jgi:RNA polymerase II elongation factor ELL
MSFPGPQANPKKGVIKVEPKLNAGFFRSMKIKFNPTNAIHAKAANQPKTSSKTNTTSNSKPASETAGTDAALAALQSSLAEEDAKKQGNR